MYLVNQKIKTNENMKKNVQYGKTFEVQLPC